MISTNSQSTKWGIRQFWRVIRVTRGEGPIVLTFLSFQRCIIYRFSINIIIRYLYIGIVKVLWKTVFPWSYHYIYEEYLYMEKFMRDGQFTFRFGMTGQDRKNIFLIPFPWFFYSAVPTREYIKRAYITTRLFRRDESRICETAIKEHIFSRLSTLRTHPLRKSKYRLLFWS